VVASIAQELRQPLASILGYSDLLLGESVGALGALQRKFLERLKASTERAGGLLEAIIRAASENGGPDLAGQAVDLRAVLDAAVEDAGGTLREKNIALELELAERLPPVAVDGDALHQILIHLLQNAALATPAGGEIRVEAKPHSAGPGYVLVEITDQGGGIPPEQQDLVFARPQRSDSAPVAGLGGPAAGLSIVKTLVEAEGGQVWLDSHPGQGTTFSLQLPVSAGAPPAHAFPGPGAGPEPDR
jgi:two-component system OmpR family sensor kinase